MNKPKKIIICVGIPCSGKSTWSESQANTKTEVICRDTIREKYFNNYVYSKSNEDRVTKLFNMKLDIFLEYHSGIEKVILDNTHCKEGYIDQIIKEYSTKYFEIEVKFFEISLLKAHYRNIIRYFNTGKWIPIKVMNTMYRNYNKINKKKYDKFKV